MERLIFHIDVNSAFLSWESVKRVNRGEPDLRLIPSAIGGDRATRHGVILAKSIPAKKYGVTTGEPVVDALRKCPDLVLAPTDFTTYTKSSRAFMAICAEYAPVVEKYSIDECFLDMTGTGKLYPDPLAIAHTIKDRIRDELGFTVNIGISHNKLLAKMASDFTKPDRVHTLFPDEIPNKMWPLPVGELFTVGSSTAEKLTRSGIRTIGDLAHADVSYICSLLGQKNGHHVHAYANGIDDSPVRTEPEEAKGYSNSITLDADIYEEDPAFQILMSLADSVGRRIRRDDKRASCIAVTIRYNTFQDRSHQCKLYNATDSTDEIYQTACDLFRTLWDYKTPIRLIGLALTDLTEDDDYQIDLFTTEKKQKARQLDKAMDSIRNRFGSDAIGRGASMLHKAEVGKKHKAQIELDRK